MGSVESRQVIRCSPAILGSDLERRYVYPAADIPIAAWMVRDRCRKVSLDNLHANLGIGTSLERIFMDF